MEIDPVEIIFSDLSLFARGESGDSFVCDKVLSQLLGIAGTKFNARIKT